MSGQAAGGFDGNLIWECLGRVLVFVAAWLAVMASTAVVELYWPDVYEFACDGAITLGLLWLIFLRKGAATPAGSAGDGRRR